MAVVALTDIKYVEGKGEDTEETRISAGDKVYDLPDDVVTELLETGAAADEDSVEALELKRSMAAPTAPSSVEAEKSRVLQEVAGLYGQEVAEALRQVDERRQQEMEDELSGGVSTEPGEPTP